MEPTFVMSTLLWDFLDKKFDQIKNFFTFQGDVFQWLNGDPCQQPLQLNASNLEHCLHLKGYDYFQVSNYNFLVKTYFWYIGRQQTFYYQLFSPLIIQNGFIQKSDGL